MFEEIFTPLDLFFADLHRPKSDSERAYFAAVMASAREGHLCLELDQSTPSSVLEGASASSPYIRRVGPLCYLEKNYACETRILEHLKRLSQPVKPLDFASEGLTDEQARALKLALSNTLTIIEGGPGTGKTFLTAYLVRSIGASVALAAPTGKAAARLKQFNPQAFCGTLHALLGIKSDRDLARKSSFIQADLIIVDESSMIDAQLMAFFLSSLQPGQRVVFLGDGHQLPPVESGSLFGDLVDLLPTAHLKQCLRSDRLEILQLAQNILAGQAAIPHRPLSEEFLIQQAVEKRTILSPLREGPFGVNSLNERIYNRLCHRLRPHQQLAVPILITRTDYEAELYNGEVGVLYRTLEKPLYAEFGERKIPASALPPYEPGYVLSVHKSQGSEFDDVVVALPPGSEAFGREVLYTAVTRAKHSVVICSDPETLQKTIGRSSRRNSGLKIRWSSS
jgi:exodeoxyribonuclease V alpha subunit